MRNQDYRLISLIENIFWIIFIIFPFLTGFFAYNWLLNESPNDADNRIISSHVECDFNNVCGEVSDAWINVRTNEIYTPSDFKWHSNIEMLKLALKLVCYGSVGYLAYIGFSFLKKKTSKQ